MGVLRFVIRTTAFLSKEIAEILRQPRLILTLVLGPFLILLLFGIGYRNQARALRTIFVVPPGQEQGPLATQIKDYATSLGPQLIFAGVTSDQAAARSALVQREVDLLVLTPPDPFQEIQNNQQATFTLVHNEIDPLQVDYVKYFGQVYVSEVNRRVLQSIAEQGQQQASESQQDLEQARANAAALRSALQAGDRAAAAQHQQALSGNVGALEIGLGTAAGLLSGIPGANGGDGAGSSAPLRSDLQGIRQDTNSLGDPASGDVSARVQQATKLENDLARLDEELVAFRKMDPHVLVQPFTSKTESVAAVQPSLSDYFSPSVIVLLLQHLAVTFAALSIVREIRVGSMELFRVSPISSLETLLGKFLSYLIFGSFLAAVLSGLVIFVLHVPLLGDPLWFALTLLAVLFTSLALGFVISLVSQTETQAVQLTMIMLLASVFFSGFMLNLDNLLAPVRVISWLIPATYGIRLLQNIMLRGYFAEPWLMAILVGYGIILFILAWGMLSRRMART